MALGHRASAFVAALIAVAATACTSTSAGTGHTTSGSPSTGPTGSGSAVPGAGGFELRGLVAPAVPLETTPAGSPDPLAGLSFAIPTGEAEYDALTEAHRQQLRAALGRIHCDGSSTPHSTTSRVACAPWSGPGPEGNLAVLLGPVVVSGAQVTTATAVAPDATIGRTEWAVIVKLNSTGAAALAAYTSAHQARFSGGTPDTCSSGASPCASYLAAVAGPAVVSIAAVLDTIAGGALQISGPFTQAAATELAARIAP